MHGWRHHPPVDSPQTGDFGGGTSAISCSSASIASRELDIAERFGTYVRRDQCRFDMCTQRVAEFSKFVLRGPVVGARKRSINGTSLGRGVNDTATRF